VPTELPQQLKSKPSKENTIIFPLMIHSKQNYHFIRVSMLSAESSSLHGRAPRLRVKPLEGKSFLHDYRGQSNGDLQHDRYSSTETYRSKA
jgi:hypothetical protein